VGLSLYELKSSNDLPEQFLSTLLPSSLAHATISVCVRGGARSAEALLPKLKLFALTQILGGLESCGVICVGDASKYFAEGLDIERSLHLSGIEGLKIWWTM
jgi:cystathionine beta-lyase/cystathionine gamma-synthase